MHHERYLPRKHIPSDTPITDALTHYFRNPNTKLAALVRKISGHKTGEAYSRSRLKRAIDVAVLPVALYYTPEMFRIGKRIVTEDKHFPLFVQKRVKDGLFPKELEKKQKKYIHVVKFKTMHNNAEKNFHLALGKEEWDDPRVTKLGKELRKNKKDELFQLWQVYVGTLSLIGPRHLSENVFKNFEKTWKQHIQEEYLHIYNKIRHGVLDPYKLLFERRPKYDPDRRHADALVAKKNSLGLELFTMWMFFKSKVANIEKTTRELVGIRRNRS